MDYKNQTESSRPLASYDYNDKGLDIEAGGNFNEQAFLEKEHRMGFIRKVYGILSFQLFLTALTSYIMVATPSISTYVLTHAWPFYTAIVLSFVLLIALMCYQKQHPTNLILLMAWTLVMAYTVGVVCAAYNTMGMGDVVIQAVVLTLLVFLGLTIFTFQSKIDFSFLGAGLFSCLWILIFWGLINSIFGLSAGMSGMLYALAGAVIFSLYIIFDTWMLINKYGYDDYIVASINLYLDIINLFLFLLRLLSNERR